MGRNRAALAAVIRKELRQTFRDKRMAMVLVMAPVLQLTLLGYAVDLDVDRIPTAVADYDHSPASRQLARSLMADRTLVAATDAVDPAHPERALVEGKASVVLVLPRGLARDLAGARPVELQALVDGTDPIRAQAAMDAVVLLLQRENVRALQHKAAELAWQHQRALALPRINVHPRLYYNPRMRSPLYMVPGVVAMVLLIVTTVVTAMGIARERELGTIEQLLVTPMRPSVLLAGKVLPFAFIGLVVGHLVLAIGTNLFDVPIRGSLAVVFVGTLLYLLSTLGSGVLISTVARNQQQAILGSFFFLMPAILLSGFMSPVENMPRWIQPLTWIDPVRYYVEILRATLLKGAGFVDTAPQLAALATFGLVIFGIASLRFRKRLA